MSLNVDKEASSALPWQYTRHTARRGQCDDDQGRCQLTTRYPSQSVCQLVHHDTPWYPHIASLFANASREVFQEELLCAELQCGWCDVGFEHTRYVQTDHLNTYCKIVCIKQERTYKGYYAADTLVILCVCYGVRRVEVLVVVD